MASRQVDVVIAGGGPAGLTLAIELGRRGVSCLLFDDKPGTTANPQAHATQARTMEHYRRLGFAHEVRALGLPPDYPTDMVCCTRFAGHELARFKRPSAKQATDAARTSAGSWSTPELPHRCALMFVEPVLRRHAEKFGSVDVRFGWRVLHFRDGPVGVEVDAERSDGGERRTVLARHLVGCDGPRPTIRRQLGIAMQGEKRFEREWMAGKMHAMYFRAPALYHVMNRPPAWMYFTINKDRRSVLVAVNGTDTFVVNAFGLHRASPALEEESAAGAAERKTSGDYLLDHLQREFNIPGVTFGVRYDGSPIVVSDGTAPPPDHANNYVPTACPGGRAPHWWLPDGSSLFDRFGREFTLLVTVADASAAHGFVAAAAAQRIPLDVLHLPHRALRDLYAADLALIRPDQHVAWRGGSADAAATLARATGH